MSDENGAADIGRSDAEFYAEYEAKDAILYSLAIGFGSTALDYQRDLRFVYEGDAKFTVAPTFCLSLMFSARVRGQVNGTTNAIPTFPPPMMKSMGVLPERFRRGSEDIDDYPILHVSQSVTWSNDMPVPSLHRPTIRTRLGGKFLSVLPKSVGAFVTTETYICDDSTALPICRVRSTTLILGMAIEDVIPFSDPTSVPLQVFAFSPAGDHQPLFEMDHDVSSQTALLYRLTSGDTNKIHVLPDAAPFGDEDSDTKDRPILHGLCTLGIASRMILQHLARSIDELTMRHLEGKFTKPIFMGDVITVQAWKLSASAADTVNVCFVVRRKTSGDVVLDKGIVQLYWSARSRL